MHETGKVLAADPLIVSAVLACASLSELLRVSRHFFVPNLWITGFAETFVDLWKKHAQNHLTDSKISNVVYG